MKDEVVITGAARTPIGSFQGKLSQLTAIDLGSIVIKEVLDGSELDAQDVDEVLMGCVLTAGLGQAPARQAAIAAGLPDSIPANTISKVCGSGMRSLMLGNDMIRAGSANALVVGGMESMSNAPYLSPSTRTGSRAGHTQLVDHMFLDGLEDAYEPGRAMGTFAEDCAEEFQLSRDQQDEYALASLRRALDAQEAGLFDREVVPINLPYNEEYDPWTADEQPTRSRPEKIPQLKPAFKEDGTVTAANSSSISDGAAALTIMSASKAECLNENIRARIVGHASHAHEPNWFTTAPIPAVSALLEKIGWKVAHVDLWEANEAFAVVPLALMQALAIPHEKMNVHGGACALGHPIGASGARIVVTLLHALESKNLKRGVAVICIGGGEATAIAIERP